MLWPIQEMAENKSCGLISMLELKLNKLFLLSVLWVFNLVTVKFYMAWPQFVTLKQCRSLFSVTFQYIEYDISKRVSYSMLRFVFSYLENRGHTLRMAYYVSKWQKEYNRWVLYDIAYEVLPFHIGWPQFVTDWFHLHSEQFTVWFEWNKHSTEHLILTWIKLY